MVRPLQYSLKILLKLFAWTAKCFKAYSYKHQPIQRQIGETTLGQMMACCLMAPGLYPSRYWPTITESLNVKIQLYLSIHIFSLNKEHKRFFNLPRGFWEHGFTVIFISGKGTSSVSGFVHHDLHPSTNDETMRPNQESKESQLVPTKTWNRSSGSQDDNPSHTVRQPRSRNTTANLQNILARPLHASLLSKVFEGKIIQGDDIDDQDGTKLHEFPKEQYTVSIIILILVVIMIILLVVTIPLVVICSVKGRPRYDSLNTDLWPHLGF